MFELLQLDFQYGIYDANGVHQYVDLGVITETQYDQIIGQPVPSASTTAQSSASQPASSAPASPAPQSSSTEPTPSSSAPQSFYQPNQSSNAAK